MPDGNKGGVQEMISGDKLIYNIDNVINRKPITADIFLTNYCNNRCKYCTYKRWDLSKNERKYVTFEEFKRNVEILQGLGVKGYILTGGGEPCINPDFDKITEWLEANDLKYGINTNFNVLKFIKPVYLKISLDASCCEEYKDLRGVDTYDKVISNINQYIEWKENNNVSTKLGLQCVGITPEQIQRFYKSVQNFKCDYIVIRPVESTMCSYYSDLQNEETRLKCVKLIEKLKQKDKRIVVNYKWYETKTIFRKCSANCTQIALDENSKVIYCCHKPFEVVGDITDSDILQKKDNFETDISKCDVPCRLTAPNKIYNNIMQKPCDYCFV